MSELAKLREQHRALTDCPELAACLEKMGLSKATAKHVAKGKGLRAALSRKGKGPKPLPKRGR